MTLALCHADVLQTCSQAFYPMLIGGSKNETVSSFIMDDACVYIAGLSQSGNFAPAEADYGYVVKICNGNVMWGKFFYNSAYAIAKIDGMSLNKVNNQTQYLEVAGFFNGKPILMVVDALNGTVLKGIEIGLKEYNPRAIYTISNALKSRHTSALD